MVLEGHVGLTDAHSPKSSDKIGWEGRVILRGTSTKQRFSVEGKKTMQI